MANKMTKGQEIVYKKLMIEQHSPCLQTGNWLRCPGCGNRRVANVKNQVKSHIRWQVMNK